MERHEFRYTYHDGQRFAFFLASDLHADDPDCDLALLRAELEEAKAEGARILLNGDIMSLILPRDLKRYTRGNDKDRNGAARDDKINEAVETAEGILAPYVDLIDMIGCGNHETAVLKHHSTDATKLLVGFLNRRRAKGIAPIRHGGYTGYIRLVFAERDGGHAQAYDIYYNHGTSGGGEVTDSAIELQRLSTTRAVDLVWLGHSHKKESKELAALQGLDQRGQFYERKRRGVVTGTYLRNMVETDASRDGYRLSFREERMRAPQGQGGAMLRITARRDGLRAKVEA